MAGEMVGGQDGIHGVRAYLRGAGPVTFPRGGSLISQTALAGLAVSPSAALPDRPVQLAASFFSIPGTDFSGASASRMPPSPDADRALSPDALILASILP